MVMPPGQPQFYNGPATAYPVLLFCYFLQSEMSVHLAYSRDGLKFTALNSGKPVLTATGQWSTIRDPYLARGPDGSTLHLVASAGNFGKADRIHYWNLSLQSGLASWGGGAIPRVMEPEPSTQNCWAPEWIYDDERRMYLVFWASQTAGALYKRIWGRWTENFVDYPEDPFVLLDAGYDTIDANMAKLDNGSRLLFFKDERGNCCHPDPLHKGFKTIRHALSTAGVGHFPAASISPSLSPQLTEGPELVEFPNPTGKRYLLYYDCFMQQHYGISASDDLLNFTAVDNSSCDDYGRHIHMPTEHGPPRHGSFVRISETELAVLLRSYGGEVSETFLM